MLADLGVEEITPMPLQAAQRPFFVGTHQARIASYIGGEHRR